jgi:hypothetical protein
MRRLLDDAGLRRLRATACIFMLVFAAALAAAPSCCDDDCSEDDGSCVEKCGPCGVVVEWVALSGTMTPSSQPGLSAVAQPAAFDADISDILHVPKRLS